MAEKKLTAPEIMSAIATAVYQTKDYLDPKKLNTYDNEAEMQHWVSWEDPISAVKCSFRDNKLIIMFTVEVQNSLKLTNHYSNKTDGKLEDIVSQVKNKYKEITGKSLGLTKFGETLETSTPISNRQQIKTYFCTYTISGIDSVEKQNEKDVADIVKTALSKAEKMTGLSPRSK